MDSSRILSMLPCERVPLSLVVAREAMSERQVPMCLPDLKFIKRIPFKLVFLCFYAFLMFLCFLWFMVALQFLWFFGSLLEVREYVHLPTYGYALGMVCKVFGASFMCNASFESLLVPSTLYLFYAMPKSNWQCGHSLGNASLV